MNIPKAPLGIIKFPTIGAASFSQIPYNAGNSSCIVPYNASSLRHVMLLSLHACNTALVGALKTVQCTAVVNSGQQWILGISVTVRVRAI